jgi:bifunctional UDP-N-acetylglucosamine pyrophosphorylase/glucosamine-1-phosphate N-acetyltransferase
MIKKAVVAAAGQGTRMLRLTNNKPKHLINVRKRPFLSYLLDNLLEAGYKEIILVVGYKEDMMKDFLAKYKPPKTIDKYEIKLVSQYEILGPKEKMYGTACPVKCVKDVIGEESFVFLYGDNLYSVKDLKKMSTNDEYCYVAGIKDAHPEKYGVLLTEDGFLKEVIEKPKEYVGDLINTGLYKFTSEVFNKLDKIKKSPRGEYEITDAISMLAKEKKVKVKKIEDYWKDFGNPGDVIKISKLMKHGFFRKFKKSVK